MSTAAPAAVKKWCSYKHGGRDCKFDVEDGHDLCIFHLPVEQKKPEDFWRHLVSYLRALYENAPTKQTRTFLEERGSNLWFIAEASEELTRHYAPEATLQCGRCWRFTGFVFPAMDVFCSLRVLRFPGVDFSDARFCGRAEFSDVESHGTACFRDARFNGEANFVNVTFNGKADFLRTEFIAAARFCSDVTFNNEVDFRGAKFCGEANFANVTFSNGVDFRGAKFCGELSFERACLLGEETRFRDCDFSGPVYLRRTAVKGLLVLDYVYLRNQLLFDGTILDRECKVLLWGLNFVHGTSDVVMEKGHEKGRIIGPAGQVVFRDIQANMNRVSFLHTDILTDRLCIRFSNVKWEPDPREFIFDAKFVLSGHQEWQEKTDLPDWAIKQLPELLFADHPMHGETPEQRANREKLELQNCERLVEQDVERIAREIRRSTEQCGSYSDAGNIHIAEMDYRRERTPCPSFYRFLLAAYKELSVYGERPGRAGRYLLWIAIAAAGGYMHAGIPPLLACLYGIGGLVPGLVRAAGVVDSKALFVAVMVLQSGLGAVLVSLLLLAIRRRFRR